MTEWLTLEQQRQWRSLLTGTSALFAALNHDLEVATGLSLNEYEILVRLSESLTRISYSLSESPVAASRSWLSAANRALDPVSSARH